jgi:hypothetical protein
MDRVALLSCAWLLGGCGGFAAERRLDLHVAELGTSDQTFDAASWESHGWSEALIARAAGQLGCAPATLRAERRGDTLLVEGCGEGVFADVFLHELLWPPPGLELKTISTHWFVDLTRDRAAEIFARLTGGLDAGDRRYFVTADGIGSAENVAAALRRLGERNRRGAEDLDCPRAKVMLSHVTTRGLTMRFAEGCGRRATYVDGRLIGLVAARDAGKLEQF